MKPVVVTVTPSCDDKGSCRPGSRGVLLDAVVGRPLVRSSPTPLVDAARALLAEGVDPACHAPRRPGLRRLALDRGCCGQADGQERY